MKIFTTLFLALIALSSFANESGVAQVFPPKVADKTKATLPGKVELIEPKAFANVSGTSVELKWKAAEGATTYRVQVAKDPNFKWIVTQQDFVKDTQLTVNGLEAGNEYHWRVFPWNKDNDATFTSGFSARSTFTVK